ncbi:DUF4573 domain-containing protein [Treponema pectinovorum]|uniref:DUF4573 domain-containing protein n=1 Tax=Treponema pectinovorum TaxID=164 RepID=UPI0011F0DB7D|nr:DUF4573 domain-containing protein [Treponema pectinovorum]
MTSSHKFSLSLLISVIAFAVFSVLVLSGRFGFIEAKFYQPAVMRPIEQRLNELGEQEKHYKSILIQRFSSFVAKDSIFSFTKAQATDEQVRSRESECARLFSSCPYLLGIRIIDSNGKRLHYSTFESDIKKRDLKKVIYEDYSNVVNDADEIPFDKIFPTDIQKYKIFNDTSRNRIVYSFSLFGKDNLELNTERAVAVFYCNPDDFIRYLFSMNALSLSERESAEYISLGENFAGYIFGLPYRNFALSKSGLDFLKEEAKKKISDTMSKNRIEKISEEKIVFTGEYFLLDKTNSSYQNIDEIEENGEYSTENQKNLQERLASKFDFTLFTKIAEPLEDNSTFVCLLYDSQIFEISTGIRILLLTILFITLFLIIFLIFNLKQDDIFVIKEKINSFQKEFLKEYVNSKLDDEKKIEDFSSRKNELNDEIIRSLGRRGKKHKKEVESLLEKNWTQINLALGSPIQETSETKAIVDSVELKNILEEILGSEKLKLSLQEKSAPQEKTLQSIPEKSENADSTKSVEEIENVEDAEPVDEVDDIADAEPVEEIESIEEIEPLEEVESVDEAEPLDDAENIEEVKSVDDAEPLEEVESADDVETLEELEDTDIVEEVDNVEPLEDIEPVEDIESVDEIEPADKVENVDDVEPLDEIESVEDAEPLDDAEDIEEVESIDDAEPLEKVEDTDDDEVLEEVEDTKTSQPPKELPSGENFEEISLDDFGDFTDEKNSTTEEKTKTANDTILENRVLQTQDDDFAYHEEVGFSSPSNVNVEKTENENFADNFKVSAIDFSFLDEEKNHNDEIFTHEFEEQPAHPNETEKSEKIEPPVELQNQTAKTETPALAKQTEQEPVLEELETSEIVENLSNPNEGRPFLFTLFAAKNNQITDLQGDNPDVIVENPDGTYSITKNSENYKEKLDTDLKKLVDSVLK